MGAEADELLKAYCEAAEFELAAAARMKSVKSFAQKGVDVHAEHAKCMVERIRGMDADPHIVEAYPRLKEALEDPESTKPPEDEKERDRLWWLREKKLKKIE